MTKTNRRGFTLIELLIVIAIIGLLASVVLIGLSSFRVAGRDARRIADLRQVQSALELYYNSCGFYPGNAIAGGACGAYAAIPRLFGDPGGLIDVLTTSNLGISKIPNDPVPTQQYGYQANTAGGPAGSKYILGAQLEDRNNANLKNDIDGDQADFGNLPCGDDAAATGDIAYCIGI
jgi:prepilin-type N-terminal cleavage/methylation domain-containing protein